jgi:hypothetical protein
MPEAKLQKAKPKTVLWWVGFWATLWWGLSCIFVVILIWQSRTYYADQSILQAHSNFFGGWQHAISYTYKRTNWLEWLLTVIICVWLAGGLVWLAAVKRQKVSYRPALKDLFLTLRQ